MMRKDNIFMPIRFQFRSFFQSENFVDEISLFFCLHRYKVKYFELTEMEKTNENGKSELRSRKRKNNLILDSISWMFHEELQLPIKHREKSINNKERKFRKFGKFLKRKILSKFA